MDESSSRFSLLFTHDLSGKPLRTFPDHALGTLSPRHCEEPLRRSNPESFRGKMLDCFASLAMTWERGGGQTKSPRSPKTTGLFQARIKLMKTARVRRTP
ncbi:protein of unknown function [Bradyrhizobium vignae]|uniref:Uncharacterized protein n=1 Tax=Bradyrhizobium vignae TaxID=1549949 RepID=A0A2U3PR02_9BRAD|nr:protein of unknown function [Bradyrhizobium vignae]